MREGVVVSVGISILSSSSIHGRSNEVLLVKTPVASVATLPGNTDLIGHVKYLPKVFQ